MLKTMGGTLLSERCDLIDVMGPLISFATPISSDDGYCVIVSVVPPGVVVPVHSHPDRETLYVIDGRLDGLLGSTWQIFDPRSVIDVPGGMPHAFRKGSGKDVISLLVTTMRMGRFFTEIGRPADGAAVPVRPGPDQVAALVSVAKRYGYHLGTDEDNAAVGIYLDA
jgi:quercetin dioxygenase-like cupin family protein